MGQQRRRVLAARTMNGFMKLSFHESGICRAAYLSKGPRPALAKWKRPAPEASGITNLFAIVVPPDIVIGAFHQSWTEEKHVYFAQPPDDDQHKTVFGIITSPPQFTIREMRDRLLDRPYIVQDVCRLRTGKLWLCQYYDGFRQPERTLIQGYISGLRIHISPADVLESKRFAQVHWFDTDNAKPHIVDIRLGTGNETFDPPRMHRKNE